MGHITYSEGIAAPVEAVFAYVDDHRNTVKYMKDLTEWAPVGSKTHGKGAKFQVAMKAGPMTLRSKVDITVWTENSTIGWTSFDGFKQTGRWSFQKDGDKTMATFDMDYELPGGIAGRMASRVADPVVRGNIEQSVKNLRSQVEKSVRTSAAKGAAASTAKTAMSARKKAAPKRAGKPPAR
jgi:uncharacterized membrane protein